MTASLKYEFPINAVLTVVLGRHLTDFWNFSELVEFITGDNGILLDDVMTMGAHVKPVILEQHPQLKDVQFPSGISKMKTKERRQFVQDWCVQQAAIFGKTLSITPMKAPTKPCPENIARRATSNAHHLSTC